MRRLLATIALALLPGCAGWQPTLNDASATARAIACTVCQATGGPDQQAAALADALRELTEAVAGLAARRAPEQVDDAVKTLEDAQARQRRAFERLLRLAGKVSP